jgi:hypothetical protein
MPEVTLQESSMSHKPFFDAREQTVVEPIATTPEEQDRRIAAIELIGNLVVEHGTARAIAWTQMNPPEEPMAPFVAAFGRTLVTKWIKFHAWRDAKPAPSLRGQVLSQVVPDRPADRCLADGAALINKTCVRCGRDNS